MDYTQAELDRAYDQRVWAPNADEVIARYGCASAEVRARVLREDGSAIDGLYAAGVDAGGVASGGYASGLAQGLVLGLTAAETVAQEV